MCRMLAKVSVQPTGIMKELEQCPNSLMWLSENGRKSHDPDVRGLHNDGCGMAYVDDQGVLHFKRFGKQEFWSNDYREFASAAQSKLYIAHNRFASEGLDTAVNGAHPFTINKFGMQLAFCHNGGVDTYMKEARTRETSDSEILLEKITENISELSVKALANELSTIAASTDYSSITGFLLARNELYIWRIFNEKRKSDFDKLSRYYTLYFSIRHNEVLIASEPLDEGEWQLLPNYKLLSLKPSPDDIEMHLVDLTRL